MNMNMQPSSHVPDHELAMASAQLHETAHMAGQVLNMLNTFSNKTNPEATQIKAWVQSKLTRIHHDLSDVRTYLRGQCCSLNSSAGTPPTSCGCMRPSV